MIKIEAADAGWQGAAYLARWKYLLSLTVLLLVGLSPQVRAQTSPFTCNSNLYLNQVLPAPDDAFQQLFRINIATNPVSYVAIGGSTSGSGLNGIGYNPANNFLYGIRSTTGAAGNDLYRINATGAKTLLGTVTGLPAPGGAADVYFSGAFTTALDNILYVKDANTTSNTMYRINVLTLTATSFTLSRDVYVADFDYYGGLFYGWDVPNARLVSINPTTGDVTNIGPTWPTLGAVGAFYADATGLYGIRNNPGGFYKFDPLTGQPTLISGASTSTGNDGARCPLGAAISFSSDLAITKTDGNTIYTPGTNVVYTIVASNSGIFGAQNARVQDALPAGITTASWTCAAAGGGVCKTASGSGAIDALVDLPIGGTATFTLTMAVPASFTGNLVNTATIAAGPGTTDPNLANNSATDTNTPNPQVSFGTCDARMFLDQAGTGGVDSTLFNMGYASTPFTFTNLGSSTARNGLGYNPSDNFIYGIEWGGASGNELIRVGLVAGSATSFNMGVISGLPVANYNNGVITPAGEYYVIPVGSGTTMYRINIATRVATAVTLTQSVSNLFDLAWHNGLMYGVSSGTLVSISTTGTVTSIGTTPNVTLAPAMWGFNNLLLAANGGTSVYAIDPASGATTLMSSSPSTNNGDGVNCPSVPIQFNADLSVTKTNTPAQGPNDLPSDLYTPGQARTYTIVVTNGSTSFGAQNVTVSDPIPAGITAATVSWTCANTSGGSRCGAASGTGALNDTGLDLPPGAVATYLVTMTVPAGFSGDLTNTVAITPPSTINDSNTANNTATDVDQRATRLTIVKSVPAGQGTAFDFSQAGVPTTATGSPNASTVASFTLNPSVVAGSNLTATQTYTDITAGTAITVNELKSSNTAQYALVNIVCANATGAPTGSTFPTSINNAAANGSPVGTATITLVAGADVTCTFNNVRNPRIVIVKNTVGGNGTFSFTETSSAAGTSLSPVSPISLATSGGSATANTTISGLSGAATTNVTITEAVTAGFSLTSVNCTNLTTGTALNTSTTPSATVNVANREVVLGGVATGSEVQCTFVNTRQPVTLTLTKVSEGGTQAFTFTGNNGWTSQTLTTTTPGVGVTGATQTLTTPDTATTITETMPTGFVLSNVTCTGMGAGGAVTTTATSFTLNAAAVAAGSNIVCTFTNTLQQTDIQVVKSASPDPVLSGQVVTYSLVVTNNGPLAASNVLVADTAGAGQDCTTPSGTATCTAAGGATCPSPTVPVSNLLGGGITLPTLPVGGQVNLILQCLVTATGSP